MHSALPMFPALVNCTIQTRTLEWRRPCFFSLLQFSWSPGPKTPPLTCVRFACSSYPTAISSVQTPDSYLLPKVLFLRLVLSLQPFTLLLPDLSLQNMHLIMSFPCLKLSISGIHCKLSYDLSHLAPSYTMFPSTLPSVVPYAPATWDSSSVPKCHDIAHMLSVPGWILSSFKLPLNTASPMSCSLSCSLLGFTTV